MKDKKLDDAIAQVAYIADCLMAYRNINETGRDCNQCAAVECTYKPRPGQIVRHNCPHYVEPKTEQNDSITCTNDSEKPNTSADHIAEADKMEPFARDRENGKDIIYRQDAIDALADAGIVNYAATGDGNGMLQAVNVIKALSPAQLPRMTDEDIQTIRIELSAVYESLCNQRRYREAKGYDGLIARFLTFAQDRPEPVIWLKDEFGSRCGACGSYAYRDKFGRPWESDYCPCCGARMEVER